ncbi:hypothetical protein QA612_17270 [Evansella sp. AB-P1]|uniref:hypothetical protein n=1 Tax=Evansella sp. AB-P1 TaxID=3037653 RepID=UPI00241DB4C6|nr:hypothetical protein [Evansella sp. AB-P1]MDG5789212.1 hypothetical protein [Evansella sp. AB-P1]
MLWLYLFLGTIFAVISLYHLFAHKQRKTTSDHILYTLKDSKKINSTSKLYKLSIYFSYVVILLTILLYVEVFRNYVAATILFIILMPFGIFTLVVLDRLFEIRGDAIVFSGYHARWGKIRHITWGKKYKNRRKLIMELDKGTKITTAIPNEEQDELEDVLSNYVHFEKNE